MGVERGVHAKVLLSDYVVVVAAVFVVVALAGGVVTYTTHIDPGTETDQEVVGVWETTGEFSHEATVTEDNRVFPVGATLEERSLYFTGVSPQLDGTFRYRFMAPDGELEVDTQVRLVIASVGDGEEYWRVEESLGEESTTLGPGEEVTTSFSVEVNEILQEIEEVEDDLGASPGSTEVRIVADVNGQGMVLGESQETGGTYELGIDPGSNTYQVENPGPQSNSNEQVETVTSEVEHDLPRQLAGPLLLLIGILGVGAVAAALGRNDLEVSDHDRRLLAFAKERDEFDDWISRGSVTDAIYGRQMIHIDDLEDLVDVAIDTDERVIEDVGRRRYYVLDESYCYEYEPPAGIDLADLEP